MRIVADNLRITNRSIQAALDRMDPEPIREMTVRCASAGAQMIDINSGPLSKNPEEKMTFLVETVQSATTLPLILELEGHYTKLTGFPLLLFFGGQRKVTKETRPMMRP